MGLQPSVATSFMLLNQRIEVGVVSRQLIIVFIQSFILLIEHQGFHAQAFPALGEHLLIRIAPRQILLLPSQFFDCNPFQAELVQLGLKYLFLK